MDAGTTSRLGRGPTRKLQIFDLSPDTGDLEMEVIAGLTERQKRIACKYLYDDAGCSLFEQICALADYYPTRTELAITRQHAPEMAACIGRACRLVELGSGSSLKTRLLLDRLEACAGYIPVDIAREELVRASGSIAMAYPELDVYPVCADYNRPLLLPRLLKPFATTAIYFPGSTIGNTEPRDVPPLLRSFATSIGRGGQLLVGVDLRKAPATFLAAYNDREGITAAFNLNLLARFNRELGATFDLSGFRHRAVYDEQTGCVEMRLVSARKQIASVAGVPIGFEQGEYIVTEHSYKFALDEFRALAHTAGFEVTRVWTDAARWFSVQHLRLA